MILVKPSHQIITPIDGQAILKRIEAAGRTCYKSEDRITDDSAPKFIRAIMSKHHESVIEHESFSVRFICDRGVTHEMVRHRIASYSQESTRYVNYDKKGAAFIIPPWLDLMPGPVDDPKGTVFALSSLGRLADANWLLAMHNAEFSYNTALAHGWKPEQARSILPNSLKTEIVMTANLREWRHYFSMRTSRAAHPQIREVSTPLLNELKTLIPVIFDDIIPNV